MTQAKQLIISGGGRLRGEVVIQGAKNAALKIVPATVVLPGEYVLFNLPHITDVLGLLEVLSFLGATVEFLDRHTVRINTLQVRAKEIPPELAGKSTATFLLAGALLGRFGEAKLWHPGGCNIGARPVSLHLDAFRRLGARVIESQNYYEIKATRLIGAEIIFPRPTVNGAVNALIAAIRAEGTTHIRGMIPEPDTLNLIDFLRSLGVGIEWVGGNSVRIQGVADKPGRGAVRIIPDRNDVATFLIAGVLGKGPVTLRGGGSEHCQSLLTLLRTIGATTAYDATDSLTIQCEELTARDLHVASRPYPGFSTDWGPMLQVLMTQVPGVSTFHETIFSHRFGHVGELIKLGAAIQYAHPSAQGAGYRFEPARHKQPPAIRIRGPQQLRGRPVRANDIRAGAALVLAGLAATGTTVLSGAEQIERGYEAFVARLQRVGALIG